MGEVELELYSRSRFLLPCPSSQSLTCLHLQSTTRAWKEAWRVVFTRPKAVEFAISALALSAPCLAREFLKIDSKHKQMVKWPVNEAEPMAPGLSVNRELRLVDPEVLMRSDLVFGAMTNVPNRYLLTVLA